MAFLTSVAALGLSRWIWSTVAAMFSSAASESNIIVTWSDSGFVLIVKMVDAAVF
jgi:hypothetical protein